MLDSPQIHNNNLFQCLFLIKHGFIMPQSCEQPWYISPDTVCPYGVAIHGFDVTIPNDMTFGQGVCIFYGFLTWAIVLVAAVAIARRRSLGNILFLLLSAIVAGFGLIWKAFASEPRPLGTCLQKCGMPSSHAQVSISYAVWLLVAGYTYGAKSVSSLYTHLMWSGAVLVIFVPMAPCRGVLNDHSADQIGIGCAIGAVEGLCWYKLTQYFIHRVRAEPRTAENTVPCAVPCWVSSWLQWIDSADVHPPFLAWWFGEEAKDDTVVSVGDKEQATGMIAAAIEDPL